MLVHTTSFAEAAAEVSVVKELRGPGPMAGLSRLGLSGFGWSRLARGGVGWLCRFADDGATPHPAVPAQSLRFSRNCVGWVLVWSGGGLGGEAGWPAVEHGAGG